jgi:hypothetical protein
MDAILTDDQGRPIRRPARSEYDSDHAFVVAFHSYKQCVADRANQAFDSEWRKQVRKGRR